MHLAELNIARLKYDLDDPRVADFVNNLDRVNAVAERSEGFVWRLKDEAGNAMSIQEIAYVTGYADPSNFHRTFNKHQGLTPNAYRRLHQPEQ